MLRYTRRSKRWCLPQFPVNDREKRKLGIGGSDAASVMRANPYKTRYELYLEKTGALEDEDQTNKYTEWGNFMEDAVRKKFKIRKSNMTWWNCDPFKFKENNYNPKAPLFAHFDGYARNNISNGGGYLVYEIKAPSYGSKYIDKAGYSFKSVNETYYWQGIHFLTILEGHVNHIWDKVCYIIACAPHFHKFFIHRSNDEVKEDIHKYKAETILFWDSVQGQRPEVPLTHSDMKLAFPNVNINEYPEATNMDMERMRMIKKHSENKEALEVSIEKCKNELRRSIGAYEGLSKDNEMLVSNKEDKNGKRVLRIAQRKDKNEF